MQTFEGEITLDIYTIRITYVLYIFVLSVHSLR